MATISGWAKVTSNIIDWSTFRTTTPPIGETGWRRVYKIECACGEDCNTEITGTGEEVFSKFQAIEVNSEEGWVRFNYSSDGPPVKYELSYGGSVIYSSGYIGDDSYQSALDTYLSTRGYALETITDTLSGSHTFYKGFGEMTFGVYIYAPLSDYTYQFTLGCPGTTTSTTTTLPNPQSILRLTDTGPVTIELDNFNAVLDGTHYLLGPDSSHSMPIGTNSWMGSWVGGSLDVDFDLTFNPAYQFNFELSIRLDSGPITPVTSTTLLSGDHFSISGIDTSSALFKIEVFGVFTGSIAPSTTTSSSSTSSTTSSSTTQIQTTSSSTSSTTTLQ